jgi:DNA-binding beta-propeller fold protein YncE
MKKQLLLMFCLMFGLVSLAVAGEQIGVFANNNTNSIQLINPETQTITSSLLKGTLGSYGGGLFDVVITPNGKTAIVSNFGDSKIFFIDISGGFTAEPTLLGQARIPFFAEDLAITPDGKYVLVTDGGFAPSIAVVNIAGMYVENNQNFSPVYSNAIAITPDGKTVLTADYFAGKINQFTFNAEDGTLAFVKAFYVMPARPVNIAISPDGKTAIGISANGYNHPVFAITDAGVEFKGNVTLAHKSGQSCVFSNDSTKAYLLSNSVYYRAMVEVMDVTGPGQVVASGVSITARPKKGTSQLFGVDTIALDPNGEYLYVANPTVSGGVQRIAIIDLTINQQVNYVQGNGIPTGIAFGTISD